MFIPFEPIKLFILIDPWKKWYHILRKTSSVGLMSWWQLWVHPFDKKSNGGLSTLSRRIPKLEGSLGKARARLGSFLHLQGFKKRFQRRGKANLRENKEEVDFTEGSSGERRY